MESALRPREGSHPPGLSLTNAGSSPGRWVEDLRVSRTLGHLRVWEEGLGSHTAAPSPHAPVGRHAPAAASLRLTREAARTSAPSRVSPEGRVTGPSRLHWPGRGSSGPTAAHRTPLPAPGEATRVPPPARNRAIDTPCVLACARAARVSTLPRSAGSSASPSARRRSSASAPADKPSMYFPRQAPSHERFLVAGVSGEGRAVTCGGAGGEGWPPGEPGHSGVGARASPWGAASAPA